jgi:hypothetical protein
MTSRGGELPSVGPKEFVEPFEDLICMRGVDADDRVDELA